MSHDLSPLHVVDRVLGVLNLTITERVQRDETGVGQILSGDGPSWGRYSIGVLGGQQT